MRFVLIVLLLAACAPIGAGQNSSENPNSNSQNPGTASQHSNPTSQNTDAAGLNPIPTPQIPTAPGSNPQPTSQPTILSAIPASTQPSDQISTSRLRADLLALQG